jgi:hypothetical protein
MDTSYMVHVIPWIPSLAQSQAASSHTSHADMHYPSIHPCLMLLYYTLQSAFIFVLIYLGITLLSSQKGLSESWAIIIS